jgi:hypothetical protein
MTDRLFKVFTGITLSIPSIVLFVGTVCVVVAAAAGLFRPELTNGVPKATMVTLVAWFILAPITLITGLSAIYYTIRYPGPRRYRVMIAVLNALGVLTAITCFSILILLAAVGLTSPG